MMLKLALGLLVLLSVPASAMELTSRDMAEGAMLSSQQVYPDCNGDNVSPQLAWSGAPPGTKSFAITLFDPDARADGWWHWIVFDIPASASRLGRGVAHDPSYLPPGAVEGQNDFQETGYGGACPPAGSGIHHYRFTLWALDTAKLPFDASVTGATIAPYLQKHALAQATLTPVYRR